MAQFTLLSIPAHSFTLGYGTGRTVYSCSHRVFFFTRLSFWTCISKKKLFSFLAHSCGNFTLVVLYVREQKTGEGMLRGREITYDIKKHRNTRVSFFPPSLDPPPTFPAHITSALRHPKKEKKTHANARFFRFRLSFFIAFLATLRLAAPSGSVVA